MGKSGNKSYTKDRLFDHLFKYSEDNFKHDEQRSVWKCGYTYSQLKLKLGRKRRNKIVKKLY